MSYLYSNGKKGERASCQRDRERVCVRDGGWLKIELASVVKMAVGETDHFWDNPGLWCKITSSWETIFMGEKDYQDTLRL